MHIHSSYKKKFFKKIEKWDTYLAWELPWSRMWFAPGETYPLHSGCADPSDFSKHGKLSCITCGRGDCIHTFPEGETMGRRSGCIFFQRGNADGQQALEKGYSSGKCKSKSQWAATAHLSDWLLTKWRQMTNVKDVEKRKHLYTVGGNVNWCSHYGNHNGGFSKN